MIRSLTRLGALALLLVSAIPAAGHTRLTGSTPAANDTTAAPVREVRLRFSLAPEASVTWLAVLRGGDTVAAGTPVPDAATGGRELALALGAELAPGSYRVVWRTAGADGHILRGSFDFVVAGTATIPAAGPAPTTPPAPEPAAPEPAQGESSAASPLPVLVRWTWFMALLGMIGAPVFYGGVLDRMRRHGLHEKVTARAAYGAWHVAAGAAALSLLTLVVRLWLQSSEMYGSGEALDGSRLASLLQTTSWGEAWTLQAIATVGYFLGLMVVRAPHGRGAGWTGAGFAAILLAAVPALSGHAAAVPGSTVVAIMLDALHVLAAGAWLGTLTVLVAAGIPASLSPADGGSPRALADLVNTFSPVAMGAALVAGLTGIINARFHIGAPAELWTTGYGRVLACKLLLLAVVGAAGAYNWRRVRPSLAEEVGPSRLRRSVAVELGAGALVVLVTAALVALPTP